MLLFPFCTSILWYTKMYQNFPFQWISARGNTSKIFKVYIKECSGFPWPSHNAKPSYISVIYHIFIISKYLQLTQYNILIMNHVFSSNIIYQFCNAISTLNLYLIYACVSYTKTSRQIDIYTIISINIIHTKNNRSACIALCVQ